MNIFEIIECTTSRTEPFHSKFLASALRQSSREDRDLFERFWELVAPREWDVPVRPKVLSEVRLDSAGSIDIVICTNDQQNRVVGIEIKTKEDSTTEGQLEKYRHGLEAQYNCQEGDLAMAFLTPFNEERAPKEAKSLPTVREFKDFEGTFPRVKHLSWLDVAEIPWEGNALWEQHRIYVYEHISALSLLYEPWNRTLEYFFGCSPASQFREALRDLHVDVGDPRKDIDIDLNQYAEEPQLFARPLVEALESLAERSEGVSRDLKRPRQDDFDSRRKYKCSRHSMVHEALFDLADRYDYFWLEGKEDYSVRVAHREHRSSGVSLIRSVGPSALRVIGKR